MFKLFQTYMWVLNYEDEYKAAFELGATGVMTDYPTKLKKFLNENPQSHWSYPKLTAKDNSFKFYKIYF